MLGTSVFITSFVLSATMHNHLIFNYTYIVRTLFLIMSKANGTYDDTNLITNIQIETILRPPLTQPYIRNGFSTADDCSRRMFSFQKCRLNSHAAWGHFHRVA